MRILLLAVAVISGGCHKSGLARLEADTNSKWETATNERFGAVTMLMSRGAPPPTVHAGGKPDVAALGFLQRYGDIFGIKDAEHQLTLKKSGSGDAYGSSFATFDQVEAGVPVFGGRLIVQFDRAGRVRFVSGLFIPGTDGVVMKAKLNASQATAIAQKDMPSAFPQSAGGQAQPTTPSLIVWSLSSKPTLAYSFLQSVTLPDGNIVGAEYVIDAGSGAILRSRLAEDDIIKPAAGSGQGLWGQTEHCTACDIKTFTVNQSLDNGNYELEQQNGSLIYTQVNGSILTSSDPNSWDHTATDPGSAVDGYAFTIASDLWWRAQGVNGYDGRNGTIAVIAHIPGAPGDSGAYWDRQGAICIRELPTASSRAAALDVIGHEFTHAVTQYHLQLDGDGEPGALRESLGDVFGQYIEASFTGGDLDYASTPAILGEGVKQGGIRNLRDPQATNIPDNKNDSRYSLNNNIHILVGVPDNAWWLTSSGGENKTSGVSVTGIGEALTQQLYTWMVLNAGAAPIGDLHTLALLLSERAGVMLGDDGAVAVACAWYAVRILSADDMNTYYGVDIADSDKTCPVTRPRDMSSDRPGQTFDLGDMSSADVGPPPDLTPPPVGQCAVGEPCNVPACCMITECKSPTWAICTCRVPCG